MKNLCWELSLKQSVRGVEFFAGLLEIKCLIDTIQNTIFGKLLDGKHTMKCRYRKYMYKMVTCIRIMFYMHLLHVYLMEKMLSMALCPPILFPVTKDMDQGTFCIHSVYIYRVYLCIHLYFSSNFAQITFQTLSLITLSKDILNVFFWIQPLKSYDWGNLIMQCGRALTEFVH